MPLIVTPGQFTQRAEFYHQLTQLTSAGIGLLRALEQVQRNPPARSFRAPIHILLEHLNNGYTFAESLKQTGDWFPAFDIALLQAGEQSGRLPECFRQISEQYRDRAQLFRNTLLALAYPLFILHFAILIFPLARLTGLILHGELFAFLLQKLLVLGPLYGIVAFSVIAGQGKASAWRAFMERLLHAVPVLGRARRCLAIARLSSALEALINAGVNILEAWELAAAASASPALMRVVRTAKPQLVAGTTPSEMVTTCGEFPTEFAQLYSTGEISGKLDDSLRRARIYFQDEGSRKLKAFVFTCAGILILGIMLLVAWQVISFYMDYFKKIQDAGQF
jgi:type II secretory pathway component PulF